MCNDTKENFLWEHARIKLNVTFHKNCEKTGKVLKISCVRRHFMKFEIHFLALHKKFSLVLLHITNYIYSP